MSVDHLGPIGHTNPLSPQFIVDPHRGTVHPWIPYCPHKGGVLCHPICLFCKSQDKALFLCSFWHAQFDMTQLKHVTKAFQNMLRALFCFFGTLVLFLSCKASDFVEGTVLLFWYSCLVSIMQGFRFYSTITIIAILLVMMNKRESLYQRY